MPCQNLKEQREYNEIAEANKRRRQRWFGYESQHPQQKPQGATSLLL